MVKGLVLPVVLRRCTWSLAAGVLQAVPTDRDGSTADHELGPAQ